MRLTILYSVLFSTMIVACTPKIWKEEVKGYKTYKKKAFWYQLHTDNPNKKKPQLGDRVTIEYSLQKGSQVIQTSVGTGYPVYVEIPPMENSNFFTRALELMGVGDSITVKIPADDIPDYLGPYKHFFGVDDLVTLHMHTYEHLDAISYQKQMEADQRTMDSLRSVIPQHIEAFDAENWDGEQTASGLFYRIERSTLGKLPTSSSVVHVHYMCYLADGTPIQDSYISQLPKQVNLGKKEVIEGWEEGLLLMKEGERMLLFIPPHLAYGEDGVEDAIPPDAMLVFFLELLRVDD